MSSSFSPCCFTTALASWLPLLLSLLSLFLTHTHTLSHTHICTAHTHTHSHSHTLSCQILLSILSIFTHVCELSCITLGHFLVFDCFCRFLFFVVVVVVFNLDQHLISFPVYSGALSQWIIQPKCFSRGDVSWQFPPQTGLCVLPGRPKPGSPPTAVLKIVDKRSRFLILDTYLLLMEEGVPCPAPAAKLTAPVKKSQDMHDERSKLVNEYACRVLELLGMGHRLFVPRLLAVRLFFIELHLQKICHLCENPLYPRKRLVVFYFLPHATGREVLSGHCPGALSEPGPRHSLIDWWRYGSPL